MTALWGSIALAALAMALAGQGAAPAPPQAQVAPAERPILWRGLRAGMRPAEVQAALAAQGIRARLETDPKTRRQFVEARGPVEEAGRPTLTAFGFVDDGLFYVDVNSQRVLASRIRFEASHFVRVARLLEERFGPAARIDSDFRVSQVDRFGFNASAAARFEGGGVRADLTAHHLFATFQPDVVETVDVRFWRTADAEAFEADRARSEAAKAAGRAE